VAAVNGANDAAAYQLATDKPVMPIGGFVSSDPSPTLQQFQTYTLGHRIHYYIESTMKRPGAPGDSADGEQSTEAEKIAAWSNKCTRRPWSTASRSTTSSRDE
jgi:hypothetical protein